MAGIIFDEIGGPREKMKFQRPRENRFRENKVKKSSVEYILRNRRNIW